MGRNNKQRRKAKAAAKERARTQQRAHVSAGAAADAGTEGGWLGGWDAPRASTAATGPSSAGPGQDDAELSLSWLRRWLRLGGEGRPLEAAQAEVEVLTVLESPARAGRLCRHLASRLTQELEWLWQHGWEPADVLRCAGRELSPPGVDLVRDLVASSLSRYAAATVSPRWHDQLAEAEAAGWPGTHDPLTTRVVSTDDDAASPLEVLTDALGALDVLAGLPVLPQLDARPGEWRPTRRAGTTASRVDARMLERVRAMLAKAESTPYEAEAETFTAAAQSLMSRHSIDLAMLAASAPRGDREAPLGRRVGVDRPYDGPKASLLNAVASANRCRSVWSKHLGFCTVFGFAADVEATETLFTSLLLQATHAMTGHGPKRAGGGVSRTRSFRQSFLLAYASRIGHRLREAADREVDEATDRAGVKGPGTDLVAVLDGRSQDVEAAVEAMFPDIVTRRSRSVQNLEGWAAGTHAADTASLFSAAGTVEAG